MKESMEAKIGRDIDTALIAFLIDSRICIPQISLFLMVSIRSKKELSHPKYLTKRTACRIS